MMYPMRSKFEESVFRSNEALDAGMYEKLKVSMLVPTTYRPDLLLPNGLIVEMKGRHPNLRVSLRKVSMLASGIKEACGQASQSGGKAQKKAFSPGQETKEETSSMDLNGSLVATGRKGFLGVALLSDKKFLLPSTHLTIEKWCIKNEILWAQGPIIPKVWWGLTTREGFDKLLEYQRKNL